jgi:hypothetical protein
MGPKSRLARITEIGDTAETRVDCQCEELMRSSCLRMGPVSCVASLTALLRQKRVTIWADP